VRRGWRLATFGEGLAGNTCIDMHSRKFKSINPPFDSCSSLAALLSTWLGVCVLALQFSGNCYAQTDYEQALKIHQEIANAVETYTNVKPELMFSIFWIESHYNPDVDNAKTTACGLAQIVRKTAESLGLEDCHDVTQSVRAATKYMSQLIDGFSRFPTNTKDQLALAAYHIGPGCVQKALKGKQACKIVETTGQDCAAAKSRGKTCVVIAYVECSSNKWLDCVPAQTRNYEHMTYDEYRPLGKRFVDWQNLEREAQKKQVATNKLSDEVSQLENNKNSSGSDLKTLASKKDQLENARRDVNRILQQAEVAKADTLSSEKTVLRELGQLKGDYKLALGEVFEEPGSSLYERDALWTEHTTYGPSDGPCARWQIYVNDFYAFQLEGYGNSVISMRLPKTWQGYVSKTGHGGVVEVDFSVDKNRAASNAQVVATLGDGYESLSKLLLSTHKFPVFRLEELKDPAEFRVDNCRNPSSPRAVSFVFGSELDPGRSDVTNPRWSNIVQKLGRLEDVRFLTATMTSYDQGKEVEFSASTIYIAPLSESDPSNHMCREEYLHRGDPTKTITVVKGKDTYWWTDDKVFHSFYPTADIDCAYELVWNIYRIGGTVGYIGKCEIPQLPSDTTYECFMNLGDLGGRFGIWVVDTATGMPRMVQYGFPLRYANIFSDYRQIGPVTLPFSTKLVFSADVLGSPGRENRVVTMNDAVIPDSVFRVGTVYRDLGNDKLYDEPAFHSRFNH
jgi:hypothetical protein